MGSDERLIASGSPAGNNSPAAIMTFHSCTVLLLPERSHTNFSISRTKNSRVTFQTVNASTSPYQAPDGIRQASGLRG